MFDNFEYMQQQLLLAIPSTMLVQIEANGTSVARLNSIKQIDEVVAYLEHVGSHAASI